MSYVTELNINGQVRTLNFNNYGREALARFYGKDTLEIVQSLSEAWNDSLLILAADCIYWGLVGDYRVNRKPIDFTIQDVSKWMQNMEDDEIAPVVKIFLASIKDRVFVKLPKVVTDTAKESEEEKKILVGKS